MESMSRLSKRAAQRLRISCLDQAHAASTSASIRSSIHADPVPAEYPRYLLRAQVQAETSQDNRARCSYTPGVGITSAKLALTLPSELARDEETYQQHLRFHCHGWYKTRGSTQWISLGDSPSWMVEQISNYGWDVGGHKIAFVDTRALARLNIPFARSSVLVDEAGLQQCASYGCECPPWNEVKYATSSHWLVWSWIPAECIRWVELQDFQAAHKLVAFGRGISYRAGPHDTVDILERALAIQREREMSRTSMGAVKVPAVTTVTELKGADNVLPIDHAMQTLTVNASSSIPGVIRLPEPASRSVRVDASTDASLEPATARAISANVSTQTMREPEDRRPARADASTQSTAVDPVSTAISDAATFDVVSAVTPLIVERATKAAFDKATAFAARAMDNIADKMIDMMIDKIIDKIFSLALAQTPATRFVLQTSEGRTPRRSVTFMPEPTLRPAVREGDESITLNVQVSAANAGPYQTSETRRPPGPPTACDAPLQKPMSCPETSGDRGRQAGTAGFNSGNQSPSLTIDDIDAALSRMKMGGKTV